MPGVELTKEQWLQLEALFLEIARQSPKGREAKLRSLELQEPALYRELKALLAADAESGGVLDTPLEQLASELVTGLAGPRDAPALPESFPGGTRIGPYALERVLGRGGMGIVYLANRADGAYEQKVALKTLHGNLSGGVVEQRFLQERKILARLQHPNIARLLDAGTADGGIPYFVMEYAEGDTLTAWAEQANLGINDRLKLFVCVLDAVQHAHRNLVIHCDLKPANILVTQSGEVRLLDFGIASLLLDSTLEPETAPLSGMFALTPEYAAPELLYGQDPTIATEVYALGAVLYELLSGCKPYERAGDDLSAFLGIVQNDPVRLDRQCAHRPGLLRELRGDLTAIVHKAIDRDPDRRYTSAESMASDIRHHLRHEPVQAQPDSKLYRLGKFTRRHRIGVAASALIALLLISGSISTAWLGYQREIEARKAQAVSEFVIRLFAGVDPDLAMGADITARQLLEEGSWRIEREFADQPQIRGRIATVLADLHDKLGAQDRALDMIEDAVATFERSGGRSLADALQIRGRILINQGNLDNGVTDIQRAIAIHRRARANIDVAEDLDLLAMAFLQRGDSAEAARMTEEGLALRLSALGREHDDTATSYNNLGVIARNSGNLDNAERYHAEALEIRRNILPERHPAIGVSLNNLGALMASLGKYLEAERYFLESLDRNLSVHGAEHPMTVTSRNNLGAVLLRRGRFAEAHEHLSQVLDYWREVQDENHPNALITRYNLAAAANGLGRIEQAELELRELLDRWHTLYGDEHHLTAAARFSLGQLTLEQGRLEEAEPLLKTALEHRRTALGDAHPYIAESLRGLGMLALAQGDLSQAAEFLEQALVVQTEASATDHPSAALIQVARARLLFEQGQAAATLELIEENLPIMELQLVANHPDLVRGRFDRARALIAMTRHDEAIAELGEIHGFTAGRFGSTAWQTLVTECWLAVALLAGGRKQEALDHAAHAADGLDRHGLSLSEMTEARRMLEIFDDNRQR